MSKKEPVECQTLSVEEAGRLLGIGRQSAYQAARNGDIPTIKIGGRVLVPKRALEHLLACHERAEQHAVV